jgi:hypothetical protein
VKASGEVMSGPRGAGVEETIVFGGMLRECDAVAKGLVKGGA